MDLSLALKCVKRNLRKRVVETLHFKQRCQKRQFDMALIREMTRRKRIVGILQQREERYRIWLAYEEHKDLNIVIDIDYHGELELVSVFPTDAERRKK